MRRRIVLALLLLVWVVPGAGVPFAADAATVERPMAAPTSTEQEEARALRELNRRLQRGETLTEAELARLMGIHHAEEEHVRMVMLPVSVTNRRGRLIRDLDAADFLLSEDRIPQEIEFFSSDTTESIHVAFLLDLSGSMERSGRLEAAKEAIRYFVENLGPDDRYALIGFADEQVSWITEFTGDRTHFLQRLMVQTGFGQTALNDAVAATPRLVDESIQGRKAIVLFSDGVDTSSRLADWDAIQLARTVDVPIYAVGFTGIRGEIRRDGSTDVKLRLLGTFARETGGVLYQVYDPDELKEATAELIDELRFQYLIGYYPTPRQWDGRFRRIDLRTGRERYEVRTRNGYYAVP
jgi:Ca-activated chloride channel family protein